MGFEIGPGFLFFSDENKTTFAIKEIIYDTSDPNEIEEREKAVMYLVTSIELYKKGKFKKSFNLLEKALSVFKTYSELSYGIGLFFVGEFYEFKEEWDNSIKNYEACYNILKKYEHKMAWDAEKRIEKIRKIMEDEK